VNDSPAGLDLEALARYFATQPALDAAGELSAQLIAGGRSNLTYSVTDGASSWIVRRPPLGHVLATAHDMAREYRVMAALEGSGVPVPRMFSLCADDDVLGAPFYVMEKVEGTPYRSAAQLDALGADRVRAISERVVDTLATLHTVDPEAVGLGDFGRPEGFLARQTRRWKKQLDFSRSREVPDLDALYTLLEARVEQGSLPESSVGIVHGDYRLDNLLVDDRDQVRAILDWEMATIGDPLTDLALLVAYDRMSDYESARTISDAAMAKGFLRGDELVARYAAGSDRDLSDLSFHLGLAYFKIAVILEGIHFRYTLGHTVGEGFDLIGEVVAPLAEGGIAALKEN
jgi:aminoglycoside phosphotransferase (APT) family kinase protein